MDKEESQQDKLAGPSVVTPQPSIYAADALLPPIKIEEDEPGADLSTTEARDYWNGGSPHLNAHLTKTGESTSTNLNFLAPHGQRQASEASASHKSEANTPAPSVHFARPDGQESVPPSRRGSLDGTETPLKGRGGSIISKLKAIASGSGLQSPRPPGVSPGPSELGSQSLTGSPTATRHPSRQPDASAEGTYDADADAEETADEQYLPEITNNKKSKRRRMRRYRKGDKSAPLTPQPTMEVGSPGVSGRFLRRRASMPDTTLREPTMTDDEVQDGPESSALVRRRRGHLRRTTVFGGGGVSDGDAMTPKRPFFGTQASTYGAHKWKQVKNTLKLLRQKKEDRFDYYKSAELMAELRAGAPAVLMLASMIQRDEHGNKRIPVLLEQLKLRIVDSTPDADGDGDRHVNFTMTLEYGSGPSRMSWTVIRTVRDIYNLHFRYKFALRNEKNMPGRLILGTRLKQPKFPYSAFPYLRGARKQGDSSDEEDAASVRGEDQGDDTAGEGTAGEDANVVMTDAEGSGMPPRRKSRVNLLGLRRRSTGITDPGELSNVDGHNPSVDQSTRKQRYIDKQRRILEKYLSNMIRWLMFRADSNRLCRFLELSALGVRLAAEGSYHGKEGYLHIQSSKGLDFRRVLTPAKVIARHSRKWFLVRQSYIVCVESPENMNIYDVYLVDPKFSIVSKRSKLKQIGSRSKQTEVDLTAEAPPEKHHTMTLQTSERRVRLFSRNQAVMRQFEESINEMLRQTAWYRENRFKSFAPVRTAVFAQWLVDGRDYMWNVSRAINMARDVIYIHDWWLSPELYMRRPACISQKWRLDRLLQKKAREGVKIFVILYRNVEAAIPIDSEYTKFSLLNLHPNIFVQRSPNQFKKNQFFFAHHEKICIVDHDVAFVGGIDLCFGRWDSPQHPITDDKPTGFEPSEAPKDAEHTQLFPGKDYSNPRVQDFFKLNEPYEEMYDRSRVTRMPWHDISMQVVGQPARDLTRHFVQRWNYLRRGRRPTRPLPFLLPPPDANMEELEALGLTGTCEVQILRSASTWSLGIEETESSIHTAYIKLIENSDHFVYMENQFFITSTEAYGARIVNGIGDALVERIIRAHENNEDWRCVILIPLMPGFQNTVDEQEGTSVRLILMCQFKSICRGENSIFGRLRAAGIEPEDYINFYSLRQWGILGKNTLVTEQLYIHAKTIIVDDRVALIGSANINERSMLGSRDSECAAIVRDTDMIISSMGGKPYQVGRFAHTLRLRLMREHLGLDVDAILEEERQQEMDQSGFEDEMDEIYQDEDEDGPKLDTQQSQNVRPSTDGRTHSFVMTDMVASSSSSQEANQTNNITSDTRVTGNQRHQDDLSGEGADHWSAAKKTGLDEGRDTVIIDNREVLVYSISNEGKGTLETPRPSDNMISSDRNAQYQAETTHELLPPMPPLNRRTTDQLGLLRANQLPTLPVIDDTDIGGPPVHIDAMGRVFEGAAHPMAADIKLAHIDKDCMRDPIVGSFMDDVWMRAAANNTKLYRRVFRCMPDSEVSTWAEYQEYTSYGEKFKASMEGRPTSEDQTSKASRGEDCAQSSVAGSVGVSAPGPGAIAKAAETRLENEVQNMAEAVIDMASPHHEKRPQEGNLNNGFSNLNEKSATNNLDNETTSTRPAALDTKSSPEQRPTTQEASSPVYAPGDTPFPPITGELLAPQNNNGKKRERRTTFSTLDKPPSRETNANITGQVGSIRRRRRATTKGSRRGFTMDDMPSRADAEELMNMVQGHLVQFPYDWLLGEDMNGNWGYQVDGVAPITIYD